MLRYDTCPLLLLLAWVAACSNQSKSAEQNEPKKNDQQNAAPATLPLLLEAKTTRTTTNVDVMPRFIFSIGVKYGPLDQYRNLVLSHAQFVANSGSVVGANFEAEEYKLSEPGLGPRFALVPKEELQEKTWYALTISASSDISVQAGEEKITSGTWRLPFFTGSAPHVSRLMVSSKEPLILQVDFSEPIELSTLSPQQFARQADTAISKCFLVGGSCQTTSSAAMESVNFQLIKAVDQAKPFGVALQTTTAGSGSTVAESAATAGYGGELSTNEMVTSISSDSWKPCEMGIGSCWSWSGIASK